MFVATPLRHRANGNGIDPTATTKNEGGRHAIDHSPDSRFQARDKGKRKGRR